MQCRKPNRAELIVTRRARVDDRAAYIQVRFRVAIVEDVAIGEAPPPGEQYDKAEGNGNCCSGPETPAASAESRKL